MKPVAVEAVTLKYFNHAENDRLYVMVSPQLGKITARSHGDRRMAKLVAGHLAPWLRTRVLLRPGRAGWQIAEAETEQQYGHLATDVLARLHVLAELIDRYALPEEPDDGLWSAVVLANQLAVSDKLSRLGFVEALAKVATVVGLAPCLDVCVLSGEELGDGGLLGWSSLHGGVIGPSIMERDGDEHYKLSGPSAIKLLRLAGRPERLPNLNISDDVVSEAEWLLLDYFQTQLDRDLKSLPSLATVVQ